MKININGQEYDINNNAYSNTSELEIRKQAEERFPCNNAVFQIGANRLGQPAYNAMCSLDGADLQHPILLCNECCAKNITDYTIFK